VTSEHLAWIRRHWANPAYRFVSFFLLNLGILALFYSILLRKAPSFNESLTTTTAAIDYWLMSLFTSEVQRTGTLLSFGTFSIDIVVECTGTHEALILTAAVVAFHASWKKKLIGLLLGALLIFGFNLLRILLLLVVGRYWPSTFHFLHIYFWQATMILMVASVWLLWVYVVVRDEEDPALRS
jgi:archaeosortase B (VPXXXP-CTERM-specific)